MSFLFVDRILALDPGKSVVGVKHVSADDVFLMPGENNQATLLPCIVGETLGQLGAWNVMYSNDFTFRPVAGVVKEAKIFAPAHVGDTILLETHIDSLDEEAVLYHSEATINGKTIFTINNALGPMLPMADFIDSETVKRQFEIIYRPDAEALAALKNQTAPTIPTDFNSAVTPAPSAHFDRILDWQKGQSVTAQKNVSIVAPYFADHFPRKPVLPLTLLLNCKLQLAQSFLSELLGTFANCYPVIIRKIKMSQFAQPGDSLITTMQLKQQTDSACVFSFKTELAGKRICVAEAEFQIKG